MLKNRVIYGLNGKRYWLSDGCYKDLCDSFTKCDLSANNISAMNHLMNGDLFSFEKCLNTFDWVKYSYQDKDTDRKPVGICEVDKKVYFVNKKSPVWLLKRHVLGSVEDFETVGYYLVDKTGELRQIGDIWYGDGPAGFDGRKETLEYIFDVIKYHDWKSYDENGRLLSPAEERKIKAEDDKKAYDYTIAFRNKVYANRNLIRSGIQDIVKVNNEAGPGSRRNAEKMLADLYDMVGKSLWD